MICWKCGQEETAVGAHRCRHGIWRNGFGHAVRIRNGRVERIGARHRRRVKRLQLDANDRPFLDVSNLPDPPRLTAFDRVALVLLVLLLGYAAWEFFA